MYLRKIRERVADLRGRGIYGGWPNKNKAIFIHIPKNAGTSVAACLGIPARHPSLLDYESVNRAKMEAYFKFCVVRDPVDRFVSAFNFLVGGGRSEADRVFALEWLGGEGCINAFIENKLAAHAEVLEWVHFRTQSSFISDSAGNVRMDMICRFESLDDDFRAVMRRLRLNASLPRINIGPRPQGHLSARSLEVISKIYREDFEIIDSL